MMRAGTKEKPVQAVSHGGGVQTIFLLHKVLRGEIAAPDLFVFCDPGAERKKTYELLERDIHAARIAGVLFVVTSADLKIMRAVDEWGGVFLPAFTVNERGDLGQLRRQCTDRFKVRPFRRTLRELGVKHAECWLGISTDEVSRVKPSDVKWCANRYPLIEHNFSRADCERWLDVRGIEHAPSACVFCPYQSAQAWQQTKANSNDFARAQQVDIAIRDKRPQAGPLYVHRSRLPLLQAPIGEPDAQPSLFDEECEGHCNT